MEQETGEQVMKFHIKLVYTKMNLYISFFCGRYVFTADPSGKIKMWQITEILQPVGENSGVIARLLATFSSCFGSRIVCLDASFEAGVCMIW